MNLAQLCEKIRLAPVAAAQVLDWERRLDQRTLSPILTQLTTPGQWESGAAALKAALGEDDLGFGTLCCHLRCALLALERYRAWGIPDEVFIATMGCFSRFVTEHLESFGCYGFDRAFWTVRQVSGVLFRIGTLEYELIQENGRKAISLHIPSDADLSGAALQDSYRRARELIGRVFPDYKDADMVCQSWLLSPALASLLPEGSRILAFQRAFHIRPVEGESEVKLWVFKNPDLPPEQLPEDTHLQRSLKAFLLAGCVFHDGEGVLKDGPFGD